MNPTKVCRTRLYTLTDLPNIGEAMAEDLRLLGYDAAGYYRFRPGDYV